MLDHLKRRRYTFRVGRVVVVFHGNTEEALALSLATQRYCAADRDCHSPNPIEGHGETCRPGRRCAAHEMLVNEQAQRTVDRLVFMRRIACQLLAEEWRRDGRT